MGEHRPYKARVTGSSPVASTTFFVLKLNGRLAQLGEHRPYKARVTGSSPVASTIFLKDLVSRITYRTLSSVGRASPLQGEGHWFKPSSVHHLLCVIPQKSIGRLAQLGEHRPYKARVTGSSPVASTTSFSPISSTLH